ncbi:MAG: type II toxin-antitoxin system VapC family toxin [Sphingomonas sp.]
MIIDASIGVKWLVPEDDSAAAIELLRHGELIVPTLFHAEVGNALWKKARRGEIALPPLLPYLAGLSELIQTVSEISVVPRAVKIAGELGHPVYDCIYLALAESADDTLLTVDQRFLRVVKGGPYAPRVSAL